jgi:hypothetical protein
VLGSQAATSAIDAKPLLRIGLQHAGEQRPQPRVDPDEVRHLLALLDHLGLAATHVERLARAASASTSPNE